MTQVFLLDTNIISETRLSRRNPGLAQWWARADPDELFLSAVSLGEIARGIEQLRVRDVSRAEALSVWLGELRDLFSDRIVSLDESIAIEWGRSSADRSRPVIDTMIAATARVRGMTLVTRNIRDVEGLGVRVLNPFS